MFLRRAFRFGYTCNFYSISEVFRNRDRMLWNIITPENPCHVDNELTAASQEVEVVN